MEEASDVGQSMLLLWAPVGIWHSSDSSIKERSLVLSQPKNPSNSEEQMRHLVIDDKSDLSNLLAGRSQSPQHWAGKTGCSPLPHPLNSIRLSQGSKIAIGNADSMGRPSLEQIRCSGELLWIMIGSNNFSSSWRQKPRLFLPRRWIFFLTYLEAHLLSVQTQDWQMEKLFENEKGKKYWKRLKKG